MAGRVSSYLFQDLVKRKLFALGLPGGVRSIAPGAAQVAAAGTDENGRHADERAFALQRVEDFGDEHGKNRRQVSGASASKQRVCDPRFFETFAAQQARIALAARPAVGIGIVTTVRQAEVDTQI